MPVCARRIKSCRILESTTSCKYSDDTARGQPASVGTIGHEAFHIRCFRRQLTNVRHFWTLHNRSQNGSDIWILQLRLRQCLSVVDYIIHRRIAILLFNRPNCIFMRLSTRQSVGIAVFSSGPVLDLEIKLLDIRQPSGHPCHGLRCLAQPLQG